MHGWLLKLFELLYDVSKIILPPKHFIEFFEFLKFHCADKSETANHRGSSFMIVEDLNISVERKRIKNINLRLYPPEFIRVTAPVRVSEDVIRRFVISKIPWIKKKLNLLTIMKTEITKEQKQQLQSQIHSYMIKWQNILGLKPVTWSLRKTKTRWGSYSLRTQRIGFSTALAYTPSHCIEYVVLHELTHIFIPHHGIEFKQLLDNHMPEWRSIQKELRR